MNRHAPLDMPIVIAQDGNLSWVRKALEVFHSVRPLILYNVLPLILPFPLSFLFEGFLLHILSD